MTNLETWRELCAKLGLDADAELADIDSRWEDPYADSLWLMGNRRECLCDVTEARVWLQQAFSRELSNRGADYWWDTVGALPSGMLFGDPQLDRAIRSFRMERL